MKNNNAFIVKDHSVSGEEFQLKYHIDFKLMQTLPQPSEDNLDSYYKSEDYISHTDSKRNLFEKAYHFVRNIALKKKRKIKHSDGLSLFQRLKNLLSGIIISKTLRIHNVRFVLKLIKNLTK